ncbi:SDR family NAD(P)-dependent oxidoreductase [Geodermatophilus sp. SYSU D00691]
MSSTVTAVKPRRPTSSTAAACSDRQLSRRLASRTGSAGTPVTVAASPGQDRRGAGAGAPARRPARRGGGRRHRPRHLPGRRDDVLPPPDRRGPRGDRPPGRGAGRRFITRPADIRDFGGLSAVVEEGVAELGRIDVVVADAGICSAAMSWEIPVEKWRETIATNLTGAFLTVTATVPTLIEQGTGGSIIITSSVAGLRGLPFLADYAASKHGVATGMQPREMFELTQKYAATLGPVSMGSLPDPISTPEDMAHAVAFLASEESRHVTGIQLPVDLGTLAR